MAYFPAQNLKSKGVICRFINAKGLSDFSVILPGLCADFAANKTET
jgi:hypothetical protein